MYHSCKRYGDTVLAHISSYSLKFSLNIFCQLFFSISFITFFFSLNSPSLDPFCLFSFPPTFPLSFHFRCAVNVDAKEGKESKEGKDWKELNKEGKDVETSRPLSVMSSLSYRKRANPDSKGNALFSSLKENADTEDSFSFLKTKSKLSDLQDDTFSVASRRRSQVGDDMDDRESVISQAYSQANSRARKGLDSRWGDFDKESTISFPASNRTSTRLGLSPEDDAKSTISLGLSSPLRRRRSASRLDDGRSEWSAYASTPTSPCFSRRSGGRSPGSVSRADSRISVARSCRLSEFDVDMDDSRSVAFTERSAFSPHSGGRSVSMPPPQSRSNDDPVDDLEIRPVSHRNYLDPDLEKAINEVLSFKPIKFKRRSLEDSEGEEEGTSKKNEDDGKSVSNGNSSRPNSSLRRSSSAVDCMRSSRSASSLSTRSSSRHRSKSKKKKRSRSSDSDSSNERHRSSSRKGSKKSKKKSKKRSRSSSSSSSSSSESESDSESSSGASTISYRSSNSVKKAPGRKVSSPEKEETEVPSESQPLNKKDEKKRKKKVDNLMMKYLYRPDSD